MHELFYDNLSIHLYLYIYMLPADMFSISTTVSAKSLLVIIVLLSSGIYATFLRAPGERPEWTIASLFVVVVVVVVVFSFRIGI